MDCLTTYFKHTHTHTHTFHQGPLYYYPPIYVQESSLRVQRLKCCVRFCNLNTKNAENCAKTGGLFIVYVHAKFHTPPTKLKAKYTSAVMLRLPFFWVTTLCQWVKGSDYPLQQGHDPDKQHPQARRLRQPKNSHSSVLVPPPPQKKKVNKSWLFL